MVGGGGGVVVFVVDVVVATVVLLVVSRSPKLSSLSSSTFRRSFLLARKMKGWGGGKESFDRVGAVGKFSFALAGMGKKETFSN